MFRLFGCLLLFWRPPSGFDLLVAIPVVNNYPETTGFRLVRSIRRDAPVGEGSDFSVSGDVALLAAGKGRGLRVHLVMPDAGFQFNQIVRIEIVVLGLAVVVSSETLAAG